MIAGNKMLVFIKFEEEIFVSWGFRGGSNSVVLSLLPQSYYIFSPVAGDVINFERHSTDIVSRIDVESAHFNHAWSYGIKPNCTVLVDAPTHNWYGSRTVLYSTKVAIVHSWSIIASCWYELGDQRNGPPPRFHYKMHKFTQQILFLKK